MNFSARNIMLLAIAFFITLTGSAAAAEVSLEDMVAERSARLYLEGQVLGDMVLGARARLDFIYIDQPLVEAARGSHEVPEWLQWNTNYFGSRKSGKDALFLLVFETFKPWTFEPEMISVNGTPLEQSDIVTRSAYVPQGDLPSEYTGRFAFTVPGEIAEPGGEIVFSCGQDSVTWVAPGK
ncbi:MAG: hypothetical protein ACP5DY_06425 [Thermovirgaceae bacterium]